MSKRWAKRVRDALVTLEGNRCSLCGSTPITKSLSVDHDHITGQIRGLLCLGCNLFLGRLGDDPGEIFERIGAYFSKARLMIADLTAKEAMPRPKFTPALAARNRDKTHCIRGHSEWKVDPRGHRYCKACVRIHSAEYRAKKLMEVQE